MENKMKRNVICIKWGTKFGADYVNRLYKMVERNLTLPHRFVCFTDKPEGILEGVEIRPLPELNDEGIPDKAWKKLGLFTDQLADLEGEALFLDLDIIIRDNIDCFFTGKVIPPTRLYTGKELESRPHTARSMPLPLA